MATPVSELLDEEHHCPACGRWFKTIQGQRSHLSKAKSCAWYRKGKNPEGTVRPPIIDDDDEGGDMLDEDGGDGEPLPGDIMAEFEDGIFDFIVLPPVAIGEAGPSTATSSSSRQRPNSRQLDDNDDTRVVETHPTAGGVIRMDESLHQKWRKVFGGGVDRDGDVPMDGVDQEIDYAPFASKLDWEVARWAIKDNPGHKAFDRLLNIPGVRSHYPSMIRCTLIRISRSVKSWAYRTPTFVDCTRWSIVFPSVQNGIVATSLSKTIQMTSISSNSVMFLRLSKVCGGIQRMRRTWCMHPVGSSLARQRTIVFILRCGQANGGMQFRCVPSSSCNGVVLIVLPGKPPSR